VQHEAKLERLLVGLRGLGLLRTWPFGDPAEADAQLRTIADMLAHRAEPPMNDALDLEALDLDHGYAAWAETYDDPGNVLIDIEERFLRSVLEEVPLGDAADIACGTGRVTELLTELGHRVIGVDPSEAMLERARAKSTSAEFRSGSFDALPVADSAVDLATCSLALTHVSDLAPPMREFARIVRPGGWVVTTDLHPVAVATGAQAFFRRADGSRGVVVNEQHWIGNYVDAFADAGLVIERCLEPLVDEGVKLGFGSDEIREAADLSLTGLPVALIWVLRRGEESVDDVVGERRSDEQAGGAG
jgi:ubiquinone/menaquinone biosynthesis C-methylase UbiE